MVFVLVGFKISIWNINPGLIALLYNAVALIAVSLNTQPDEATRKNFETFASYNPSVQA